MFRRFLRFLNIYVGTTICLILYLYSKILKKSKPPRAIKKILVIKLAGIGDSVLILSVLDKIKKINKNLEIDVLASYLNKDVFKSDPSVNNVLNFDFVRFPKGILDIFKYIIFTNEKKYDCVIDMEHFFPFTAILAFLSHAPVTAGFYKNSQKRRLLYSNPLEFDEKKHLLDNYSRLACNVLGLKDFKLERVPPHFSSQDALKVQNIFKKYSVLDNDFIVCINPGGSGLRNINNRRLWPIENLTEVINWVTLNYKVKIILVGSKNEAVLGEKIINNSRVNSEIINLIGKLELKELIALLGRINFYMGNDTGPSHIAYAFDIPSIIFYGPDTPVLYGGKYTSNSHDLYKNLPCSPCNKVYLGQRIEKSKCKSPKCLEAISIKEVKALIESILGEYNIKKL